MTGQVENYPFSIPNWDIKNLFIAIIYEMQVTGFGTEGNRTWVDGVMIYEHA
jgi:hypothetical protein